MNTPQSTYGQPNYIHTQHQEREKTMADKNKNDLEEDADYGETDQLK
jgi:hypothetical protein